MLLLTNPNSYIIERNIYDWPSHKSVALNKWNDYNYIVNSNNLKYHVVEATTQFNNAIINKLSEDMSVMVQLKLIIDNHYTRSMSFIQTIRPSESFELLKLFEHFWFVKGQHYNDSYYNVTGIRFTYKILPDNIINLPSQINRASPGSLGSLRNEGSQQPLKLQGID